MHDSLTEQIAQAFRNCTLPKQAWSHEAHLRVGLWYLLHYSPTEAMCRLRDGICQYNTVCGVANTDTSGYHETITQFYVMLIRYFLQDQNISQQMDQIATKLLKAYGDRDLIFDYYSKDRLTSKEARSRWVEPDLLPMPTVEQNK